MKAHSIYKIVILAKENTCRAIIQIPYLGERDTDVLFD